MADLTQQIKAGLSGQAAGTEAPAKSTVAADVAASAVNTQKQELLQKAQEVKQKQTQQATAIATADSLSADQAKQRENTMLQHVNRQINDLHMKLQNQQLDLAAEEYGAELEQLSFLNNLSNRKWADTVKAEGTKRRLDNEMQMKEALLYANFDDMMSMLNSDMTFKKAMLADAREFQEYLATIEPQAVLNAAIQMQREEYREKAIAGAAAGVSAGAQQLVRSGYFEKKQPTGTQQ